MNHEKEMAEKELAGKVVAEKLRWSAVSSLKTFLSRHRAFYLKIRITLLKSFKTLLPSL